MNNVLIEIAVNEGFPADWSESKYGEWLSLDEEISFIDYLYRLEARRGCTGMDEGSMASIQVKRVA